MLKDCCCRWKKAAEPVLSSEVKAKVKGKDVHYVCLRVYERQIYQTEHISTRLKSCNRRAKVSHKYIMTKES